MECPASIQAAQAVARQLLDREAHGVELFQPAVGGDDSWSFRCSDQGRALLLKIKRNAGSPIGVCFYQRIRAAGVPCPELVAWAPAAGPQGQACALWEWVDGVPADWKSPQRCPYDERAFGRVLRQIHALEQCGPFGRLGDPGGALPAHLWIAQRGDTWLGTFPCARAAARYHDCGYLTTAEADALAALPARLAPHFAHVRPHLLHMGDLMHQGNMLCDPHTRQIRAVLDHVESTAGDPRWELAWIDYYFLQYPFNDATFDLAAFREGYGATHDPQDVVGRFYLLAVLLFEKLLFFKPDSPRGTWAIATAKRLIGELACEP